MDPRARHHLVVPVGERENDLVDRLHLSPGKTLLDRLLRRAQRSHCHFGRVAGTNERLAPRKIGKFHDTAYNYPSVLMCIPHLSSSNVFGQKFSYLCDETLNKKVAARMRIFRSYTIYVHWRRRFLVLKKKPNVLQFVAAVGVFLAIFFCLIPSFASMDPPQACDGSNVTNEKNISTAGGSESLAGRILWPLCFVLGLVPVALMNVLEERSLQGRHRRSQINLIFLLFCTSCYQLLISLALFWADIIPGFGMSDDIKTFGEK